jgi:signal transduction histidine kinase/CHASE1-domain containing sensor protein
MPSTLPFLRDQPPQRATVLVWVVGVACALSISIVSWMVAARTVERDAQNRFQNLATNTRYSIGARVKSYNDLIRGVAALFQISDDLDHAQFHRYVGGLDLEHHFPAIDTLNYAEYVPHAQRARFEARVRADRTLDADGNPDFAIHPAGERNDYYVMTYIEPLENAGTRFGLDIAARPVFRQTLELSRDTGVLSASGQPILVDGDAPQATLAMRLPVYRDGMPLDTVAQRRVAYRGSVGAGFNIATLIRGALDEMTLRDVHFVLFDGGPSGIVVPPDIVRSDMLIFDSRQEAHTPPASTPPQTSPDRFTTVLPIDFNGRNWKACFSIRKSSMYTGFDVLFPWIAAATGLAGTMLIYGLFYALSSSRRRAIALARAMTAELRASEARLLESHRKLRQLAAHTDQIKEDERKRIAREIHDDLGQNLLALRIDVVMLAARTEPHHPKLNAKVRATMAQIDATIKSVRQIINDLRPNVLDLGLVAAVEWQISQFQQRSGIRCELREPPHDIRLDDKSATALFRILQESLNNISKHAKASNVMVDLAQVGDAVSMSITDNGVGMQLASRQKAGSFGLIGIEERVNLLGGQLHIESSPGMGVTILVTVPLPAPRAADTWLGERI